MGSAKSQSFRRERLFSDPHLLVELLAELGATVHVWSGFLKGDEYRRRMDLVLELLRRHGIGKVLADVSRLRPLVPEDMVWTNEDWAPRAVVAGLRAMAVVLPRNVFAQMSVTQVVTKLGAVSMTTAQFDEVVDALRWLEAPTKE